jgi:hypothetical protein
LEQIGGGGFALLCARETRILPSDILPRRTTHNFLESLVKALADSQAAKAIHCAATERVIYGDSMDVLQIVGTEQAGTALFLAERPFYAGSSDVTHCGTC